MVFLGDGTLGEGTVYETFNLASKWELPLLFVLENNSYAQSTSQEQTLAGSIRARAESFDIAYSHASTWEPERLLDIAAESVSSVRMQGRPAFLQVDTYRLMPHSKGDDNRDSEEIAANWARDPMRLFYAENSEADPNVLTQVKEHVDGAVSRAEQMSYARETEGDVDLPRFCKPTWKPVLPVNIVSWVSPAYVNPCNETCSAIPVLF